MPRALDTSTWGHFVSTETSGKIPQRACKHCGKKVPAVSRTRAIQHLHKCAIFNQGVADGQYEFPAPPVPRNSQPFPNVHGGATFTFPAASPYTPTAPPRFSTNVAPQSAPPPQPQNYAPTLPHPQPIARGPPLDFSGQGKEALDKLAAKAVHECGLPFGVFQFPAMVEFLRRLNPSYQPPNSEQLRRKLLDQVYGDSNADPLLLAPSSSRQEGEPHELQLLVDAMEAEESIPGLESLPASEIERFIDAYFDVYHVMNPIVHEASFRAQYSKVIPRQGEMWEVLQHVVAAIGCACLSTSGEQKTAGLLFEAAHAKLTADALEGGSQLLIQILVLVANYLQMAGKSHAAYNYLGLAKRMAIRIGLHKDHSASTLSPWQNESRRRIWWSLSNVDFVNILAWFRPRDMSSSTVTTQYPLNINDADLTVATGRLPREVTNATIYSFIRIQAQFFTAISSIYARISSEDIPHPTELMRLDDEAIGTWLEQLPPYFQEYAIQQSRFELPHAVLRWRYRNFRIFMYRSFVVKKVIYKSQIAPPNTENDTEADPQAVERAVQRCWQAARETIDLVRGLTLVTAERRPAIFISHGIFYLFQAVIIPLILLRNDTSNIFADDWRGQILQAQEVFDRFANDNVISKRCAAVLRRDATPFLERRASVTGDAPERQVWGLNQSLWQAGANLFPSFAPTQQEGFLLDFFGKVPGFV